MEMAELSRLLVSISAITRNNIDVYPSHDDSTFVENVVGVLTPNLMNSEKQKSLEFREACNKVLHADYINPGVEDKKRGLDSALESQVYLYGRYRGDNWRAVVDIYPCENRMRSVLNTSM